MTEAATVSPLVLGGTYQHFVEFLKDTDTLAPVLSPKRFSQAMHGGKRIDVLEELDEMLVSPAQHKWCNGRRFSHVQTPLVMRTI